MSSNGYLVGSFVLGALVLAQPAHSKGDTAMNHRIERVDPQRVSVGPAVGLALAAAGVSVEQRYQRLLPSGEITSKQPLSLIWKGQPLSSPDRITVVSALRNGGAVRVVIDVRRFDGTLHANVVTVPVVAVELGVVAPGSYTAELEVMERTFSAIDDPSKASEPVPHRATFAFVIR